MKTKMLLPLIAVLAGVLLAAGCSTPQSRIRDKPGVFARLTPEQQSLIQQGKIALGFDPEMVELALGEPDRTRTRTDATGTSEIWSYVTYEAPDGVVLYRGWYHRYYLGGDPLYPYYLNYPARQEHEHFRVVFQQGRVAAIEQEKSP